LPQVSTLSSFALILLLFSDAIEEEQYDAEYDDFMKQQSEAVALGTCEKLLERLSVDEQ
jgi:hypothetical protein